MKKTIYLKDKAIGDGKITIQSMTNTPTADSKKTLLQINELAEAGADFVRVSVPDLASADALKEICQKSPVPVIGDIHFDYLPAIAAIENGVSKIRINPSNMPEKGLREVVKKCIEYNVPVRVGVNKGSVREDVSVPELVSLTLDAAKKIEDLGWDKLVLAVKTSDPTETVKAYRLLAEKTEYPLHIGLTEAGTPKYGLLKSAVAIGALLTDGIGDTVRVSLTGDPVREVLAAKDILIACGIEKNFVDVISCPTCARTQIDVENLASKIQKMTADIKKPLKIAVMGCVVNGIGEGKFADLGVAGGKERSVIFADGKKLMTVPNEDIEKVLTVLIKERTYE